LIQEFSGTVLLAHFGVKMEKLWSKVNLKGETEESHIRGSLIRVGAETG
jgi:hypothetical protein